MTEWRTVERPSTLSVQPRAQVVGDIPDAHVITVRERRVTVDYPTIVQNNVNTDVIELDLDGEWDGMSVVLVLGPCGGATELAWHGEPVTLPSALAEDTGGIDVSVVGYSADGETRLVTVAAPSLLSVIKSGCTVGEAPAEETPDLIGQLVAAGDAADKAAKAANTAAAAANGAAGIANAAASAANTAAGKADTAAADASGAAEVATDAATDADRAAQSANAAAEAASAAAEAARGNVLKGTLGPAPLLSADDAYATKPRKLTVYGATRQNLWVNPSGTKSGVTVTSNVDGSVTLSGTSTGSISLNSGKIYTLRPSTEYTVSVDKALSSSNIDPSNGSFFIEQHDSSGANISNGTRYVGYGTTLSTTFTTSSELSFVYLGAFAASGKTLSGTYRVMLNEGSEPEPWCPPGLNGVEELSIVTAGKNLLTVGSPHTMTGSASGINFTLNDDGSIRCVGSVTGGSSNTLIALYGSDMPDLPFAILDAGTYNYETVNGTKDGYMITVRLGDLDNENAHIASSVRGTFKLSKRTRVSAYLVVGSGATNIDVTVWCTITRESAIGEKLPAATITPIDLDGHTLNGLSDGTRDELRIDGTGAVTLVQRVGVATAPTAAGSWSYEDNMAQAFFSLPSAGPTSEDDETGWLLCDKLPVRQSFGDASYAIVAARTAYAKHPAITSTATAAAVAGGATYLYPLAAPQTIPLPAVTLPTLPAPTVNVWADAEASGAGYAMDPDVELEYERDVTIAFNKLQAQISATTVREATNG